MAGLLITMELSAETRKDKSGKNITQIMAMGHPGRIKVPIARMVGSDDAMNQARADYLLWAWDCGLKCRKVCEALIHLKGPSGWIGEPQAEHLDKAIDRARKALADVRPRR